MNKFKVGERAFDLRFGWGEICIPSFPDKVYSVCVQFARNTAYYTLEGRGSINDEHPILWTKEEAKKHGFVEVIKKKTYPIFIKQNDGAIYFLEHGFPDVEAAKAVWKERFVHLITEVPELVREVEVEA